jgi:hypothetical protein
MFPAADWQSETLAWVQCPGAELHTSPNGRKDCRVTINDGKVPTVFCCHNSCRAAVEEMNYDMRSAIGKLKSSKATGNHVRRGLAPSPSGINSQHASKKPVIDKQAKEVPLAPLELPQPLADGQALHFATCFRDNELAAVVFGAGEFGKVMSKGVTITPQPLEDDHNNGTYVRVNPMKPDGAGDADVTAWRHCLIECDKASLELQWAAIVASRLPVSVVVYSGGRSVHAWVRVDASTAEEYRERARTAAQAMEAFEGIKVDRATLNPSRLARLAGRMRGDKCQDLLAVNIGATCWDDWVAGIKEAAPEVQQIEPSPSSEFYYRKKQKDFLIVRGKTGEVIPLDKDGLTGALDSEGLIDPEDKAAMKAAVNEIRMDWAVDYDGSMPGYCRGLHRAGGKKYYCDTQAKWLDGVVPELDEDGDVAAVQGQGWPTINVFLQGLLIPEGQAGKFGALNALFWSLKLARETLVEALTPPRDGEPRAIRPGPASVFCGPRNCGKSFLVNSIITPLLGGRTVDAHKAFTSDSEGFNGELLEGEIWTVDDKVHACDLNSRRQFAANIKNKLYAGHVSFHAKFKNPVTIQPWARLFILCNDQDEAIRVLPVLTDDLADKMHFWRCYNVAGGLPTQTGADWHAFGAQIRRELPAFAGWLDALEIPETKRDSRNGIKCWQDPHIVNLLADQTPEHQLGLLLVHLFDSGQLNAIRNKTAQEILQHLSGVESVRGQLRNLLHDDPALLGKYLGRLVATPSRLAQIGLNVTRGGLRHKVWGYDIWSPPQV